MDDLDRGGPFFRLPPSQRNQRHSVTTRCHALSEIDNLPLSAANPKRREHVCDSHSFREPGSKLLVQE
jgi:hypothetical protein